jgi:hypothetical protein
VGNGSGQERVSTGEWVILAAACVAGCALRVLFLAAESLWYDEVVSYDLGEAPARRPLSGPRPRPGQSTSSALLDRLAHHRDGFWVVYYLPGSGARADGQALRALLARRFASQQERCFTQICAVLY